MTDAPATQGLAVREETSDALGLLRLALEKDVSVEALEKLVMLHERIADRAAARDYARALAEFQHRVPTVPKTSVATHVSRTAGTQFSYTWAKLNVIAETIRPFLHELGLSYSWDNTFPPGEVATTCTLRHENGHHESATFAAPVGNNTAISAAQNREGALTTARRMSLELVLGLSTGDEEEEKPEDYARVTPEQVANLDALIVESKANRVRLLGVLKVERLEDLDARNYASTVAMLEEKRKRG